MRSVQPHKLTLSEEDCINLRDYAAANQTTASRVIRALIREHIKPVTPYPIVPVGSTPVGEKWHARIVLDSDVTDIVRHVMDQADVRLSEAVNFLIRRAVSDKIDPV